MQRKSLALAGLSVASLLALAACSDPNVQVPGAGQGTGSANAEQPAAPAQSDQPPAEGQAELPPPPPVTMATQAPAGGAAAKVGDQEVAITRVACTTTNGQWSMSGGDDNTKVAVTGSEDRATVTTASVVLQDGTVVQFSTGHGEATIGWEGQTFTVAGKGESMNLNDPDKTGTSDFAITATCTE